MRESPGACSPAIASMTSGFQFAQAESKILREKGPHLQLQSNGGRWRNGSPPSLPEPGVWTGMASANALAPLRWKRAKIHRGSRQGYFGRIGKPDIRQQL